MAINVRRIVTAHANDGKAIVGTDEIMTNIQQLRSGNFETLLWVTDSSPADVNGDDLTGVPQDIEPPETGSIFRILELIPGKEAYMHRIIFFIFSSDSDLSARSLNEINS